MRRWLVGLIAVTGLLAGADAQAQSQPLVVFSGGSMVEALKLAGADYASAAGRPVRYEAGTTGVIQGKVRDGQPVDVVVISAEGVTALQQEGLIESGAPAPVADAVLGVGVKAGAPKPDIATPEAFKAAMLAAKSISYPDPDKGATAGVYLKGLFEKMGIGPQMAAKTVLKPMGAASTAAVAEGEAELVVTFVSEMKPNKGVEVVGLLPGPILNPIPYTAGVAAKSADPAAARAFVAFVTSAKEKARLEEAGVRPAR